MAVPEQWTLCCDWLRRVGLIGSDHLLATKQAKLTDLCTFLRDGVMLCKLVHLLDRNSIDLRNVNQRPHKAQFLCSKNIGIFLQTCEDKFDLHKDDLFEPPMLFESTNFKKVLQTLSKLSNCPKAQRLLIPGFTEERNLDGDNNGIYETLEKDMADMANGPAGDLTHPNSRPHESPDDYLLKDNKIYAELNLCSQDLPASRVEAPDLTRKRDLCLQEIVETENNYASALNMLCTQFLEPLKKILTEEQIKKIFGCIPDMARIHQGLYRELREAQNNPSGKTISEVFLEHQEQLFIYGEYCANLATALQEVEDIMSNNEEARNLIQECQSEVSEGRHQLRGYLVVPVQRILKYHLLLQELVRHTQSQSHSDLEALKRAHEAMKDLADYINEAKRDKEMLEIIRDVRNSIMEMPVDINDWQALGKLRHDGETKIECHPEPIRKRYVFVFDKVMVICSKQTRRLSNLFLGQNGNRWSWGEVSLEDEKYFFKDSVKLENCRVQTGSNMRGRQNSFFLVVDVNEKAYTIITKDSDTKEKWLKIISDAIEYLNPHKNLEMRHTFAITTFFQPTRCMLCSKLLKGTIFQGYKCSKCELVVHRSCLNGVQRCEERTRRESPIPPHRSQVFRRPSDPYPGYGNLQFQQYAWWVGEMTREKASDQLHHQPDGTFLIRWSDRHQKLVLSLKVAHEVKHMRILKHEETDSFYLSEVRFFRSVEGLVNYYRVASLSECFSDLFAHLTRSIYEVAIANHSYRGQGSNHLSLELGDKVIVISHHGESNGWWKGRIENRVGYFPRSFVTVQNNLRNI